MKEIVLGMNLGEFERLQFKWETGPYLAMSKLVNGRTRLEARFANARSLTVSIVSHGYL